MTDILYNPSQRVSEGARLCFCAAVIHAEWHIINSSHLFMIPERELIDSFYSQVYESV